MSKQNEYFPQSVPHPGLTLVDKLDELGMGPKEFALRTGKPEKTIIAIIKGKSSITPDMAVLFENVLHIPAHYWLNRQQRFDESIARSKSNMYVTEAVNWAKKFPIIEMIKNGWLPETMEIEEKADALLKFFRISNASAWDDYYISQKLKLDFRISLNSTHAAHSISAWLRQGEISAEMLDAPVYDEKKFRESLNEIKSLMATQLKPFKKLQEICLASGVKLVYTPCLPKAPINGSTRWINNVPLIQLSGRYNRNDIFWFTFFHEAGHILLHGKKDIFLEEVDYDGKDVIKEKEADAFAVKWTLSEKEEAEISEIFNISDDVIVEYAKKFNTHPAIIVGRLRRKGIKSQKFGQKFLEPVFIE
ncbi:MAG: ImmA/IrrE family metallo-endopeptidase [Bacteroidia bacterium]|nr:ImmA/IrrE family metallo-endopeptidase [Bacteroidia bacterium]